MASVVLVIRTIPTRRQTKATEVSIFVRNIVLTRKSQTASSSYSKQVYLPLFINN